MRKVGWKCCPEQVDRMNGPLSKGRLSQREIERMLQDAEQHKAQLS